MYLPSGVELWHPTQGAPTSVGARMGCTTSSPTLKPLKAAWSPDAEVVVQYAIVPLAAIGAMRKLVGAPAAAGLSSPPPERWPPRTVTLTISSTMRAFIT